MENRIEVITLTREQLADLAQSIATQAVQETIKRVERPEPYYLVRQLKTIFPQFSTFYKLTEIRKAIEAGELGIFTKSGDHLVTEAEVKKWLVKK